MGRRRARPSDQIVQSDEAKALLKQDIPMAVKVRLRLALKGGRMARRRCLGCSRVGVYCKVWSPEAAWRVESEGTTGIKVYWLCARCNDAYADGLPLDLARKLGG
jgi:hypothetical protein